MQHGIGHQINPGEGRFKSAGAIDHICSDEKQQVSATKFRPIVADRHVDFHQRSLRASSIRKNRSPAGIGIGIHDPDGEPLQKRKGATQHAFIALAAGRGRRHQDHTLNDHDTPDQL